MSKSGNNPTSAIEKIENLFEQVRQMEPGGDLEGLLQEHIQEITVLIYEQALQARADVAAAGAADFPPCALSALRRADAAGGPEATRGQDPGRKGPLPASGV